MININEITKMDFEPFKRLQVNPKDDLILYGAGIGGSLTFECLERFGIRPVAICDSNKVGSSFEGYKVCNIQEIVSEFENPKVLISSFLYFEEIKKDLLNIIPEAIILPSLEKDDWVRMKMAIEYMDMLLGKVGELESVNSLLEDEKSKEVLSNILKGHVTGDQDPFIQIYEPEQYFVKDIIQLGDEEVFVDGGAYTGDTLELFIQETNSNFKDIYCFEPSGDTFNKLTQTKQMFDNDERIKVVNAGLYRENTMIGFDDDLLSAGNAIDIDSRNKIRVVSIDEFIDEEVTYIKMDIEGAELDALEGARDTIVKFHPKLAICVYHKVNDIVDIPLYIASLGLDYRYYLRHHGQNSYETVLYAIPK